MGILDAFRSSLSREGQRERLVSSLQGIGYLKSPSAVRGMLDVRRELFVPEGQKGSSYDDRPLPIGYGQTISAPHMVAIMVEALDLRPGQRVLEVGGGSGYHAAVTAHMVVEGLGTGGGRREREGGGEEGRGTGEKGGKASGKRGRAGGKRGTGHVFTVEYVPELAAMARKNLGSAGLSGHVTVIHGDGSLGIPEEAPFDRIFIACAAPRVPPPLVGQLREGGKLLAPLGRQFSSELTRLTKRKGRLVAEELGGCAFVPLVGRYG